MSDRSILVGGRINILVDPTDIVDKELRGSRCFFSGNISLYLLEK
jgi:hypothetical protein